MSTKDDNIPRYREVTAEVRFLYPIWKDEDEDLSYLTLEQMAYHITDANGEFLGVWGFTSAKTVGVDEAEKIAIELGNDGSWPKIE